MCWLGSYWYEHGLLLVQVFKNSSSCLLGSKVSSILNYGSDRCSDVRWMEDLAAEGAIDEKGSLILRKERVFNSYVHEILPLCSCKRESLIHISSPIPQVTPTDLLNILYFYTVLSCILFIGPTCQLYGREKAGWGRGRGTPTSGGLGERNESPSSIGAWIGV